jgi:type II secretory pathway component PulF
MIITPARLSRRAEFYRQLGAMITAGVPLIQALQMASDTTSLRSSKKDITQIIDHLKNGLTFTDSMNKVHGWMPEFDKSLLSAGEQSGKLDYTFKVLGEYYGTRADIIRQTIQSLILPAVNLHVLILVFPLLLFTGMVIGLMNNNEGPAVIYLFHKLRWFGSLYALVLTLIYCCQASWGEPYRHFLETLWHIVPILRKAVKYLSLSRLAVALEALISSGVLVTKSWALAARASGSPRLEREISTWQADLDRGATPAELVNRFPYFPDMFRNLYQTGEVSGQLDESLRRLHTYYQEEGIRAMRLFCRVLSTVIYIIIAVIIAINVVGFYVGYYNNIFNSVQ